MMSLELRALSAASRHQTALVCNDVAFTGAELNAAADRVAEALAHASVDAGRRVALLFGNTPQFVVSMVGVMKLRASAVLLSTRFTHREIGEFVRRTGAAAMLAPVDASLAIQRAFQPGELEPTDVDTKAGQLRLWRSLEPGALAPLGELTVQFTSGVGGRSKIVPRTVTNLADELENFSTALGLGWRDATVCPCPLFHTYGLINGFLVPFFSGRPAVLVDWFLPNDAIDLVRRHRARVFVGVPSMFKTMCDGFGATSADLASLRICFSAGAPLPEAVARTFEARFGKSINQQYGTTETGVIAASLSPVPGSSATTVGHPLPGRRVDIVADDGSGVQSGATGEIVVRSGGTAASYLDDPSLSAQKFRDGRYFTGDIGRLGEDGELIVSGRRAMVINVAGLKVDPAEVEHVLAAFEAVAECAVVPARDPSGGQVVKAVVVSRRDVSEQEIQRYCRQYLAGHKVPRQVAFVDELPRSATGKVLTKHLIDD